MVEPADEVHVTDTAPRQTFIGQLVGRLLFLMAKPCMCEVPVIRLAQCPTCLAATIAHTIHMATPTYYINSAETLMEMNPGTHPYGKRGARDVIANQRQLLKKFRFTMAGEIKRIEELLPKLKRMMQSIDREPEGG